MKRLLLLASVSVAGFANAQVLYSTNFDAPTWTAGSNGVGVAAGGNTANGWLTSGTAATIVATGQTNAGGVSALSGTQMLRMTTAGGSSSANWNWKDISGAWAARTAGNNVLHASTSFFIPSNNNRSTFYGLQAYNTAGDVIGEFVVQPTYDATNSAATVDSGLWSDNATVTGATWTVGKTFMRGAWNKFDLYVDTVGATVHGTLTIGATTLDLGTYGIDPVNAVVPIGDVDFFAGNSVAQGGSGVAPTSVYFDDFGVEAVPEPCTIVCFALGAVGLAARRRRK